MKMTTPSQCPSKPTPAPTIRPVNPSPTTPLDSTENRERPKSILADALKRTNHRYHETVINTWGVMRDLDLIRHNDSLMVLMGMKLWDQWLVEWIEHPLVKTPQEAMCILIQQIFNVLRLPLSPVSQARVDEQTRRIHR